MLLLTLRVGQIPRLKNVKLAFGEIKFSRMFRVRVSISSTLLFFFFFFRSGYMINYDQELILNISSFTVFIFGES